MITVTAALTAQRTWVVDPENRAGTDFTNLRGAVTASAPGDTVRIRASTQGLSLRVDINKGITIVGEGANHNISDWLVVHDLPANERFVLRDLSPLQFSPSGGLSYIDAGLAIYSCRGSVHVQGFRSVRYQGSIGRLLAKLRIVINNSSLVTLRNCETVGQDGGLQIGNSTVLTTNCLFAGNTTECPPFGPCQSTAYLAASIGQSTVHAVDTVFEGGLGWVDYLCGFGYDNQSGVRLNSAQLWMIGPTSAVRGGNRQNSNVCIFFRPAPAAIGTGTIHIDGGVEVFPPVAPTVAIQPSNSPVVRSSLAPFGGTMNIEVTAAAGALAATFASLPATPTPFSLDRLWLEPTLLAQVDLATVDATGRRAFTISSLTVPDEVPLMFQTATLQHLVVRLTTPSITIVGR